MKNKESGDVLKKIMVVIVMIITVGSIATYLGLSFGFSSVTATTVQDPLDGWVVYGNLYIPRGRTGPMPAVILAHGDGGDRLQVASIASAIAEKGIMVMCIDLSGNGQSPYPFTLANQQHDYKTIYYYLCNRTDVDKTKIGVAGFSRGGQVSCLSVFHIPVKYVASISYTWDDGEFSPSYPANIIFVTGTSDTMMYTDYQLYAMRLLTGISQPREGVLYGSLANNTGREYVLAQCAHADAPLNQKVVDTVEEWFDQDLNDATNTTPSTFLAKTIIQYIGIAGVVLVVAWAAYSLGKRRLKGIEVTKTQGSSQVEVVNHVEGTSRIHAAQLIKGISFVGLYYAAWAIVFALFSLSSTEPTNIYNLANQVRAAMPFVTGNLTIIVILVIATFIPTSIPLFIIEWLIVKKLNAKTSNVLVSSTKGGSQPKISQEPYANVLTLKTSFSKLRALLIATVVVLGIFLTGMVLLLHFTTHEIVPTTLNQIMTFVWILPFSFAFAFIDQSWFGLIIQRDIVFQQNRKCFIMVLASFILKLGIVGVFFATQGAITQASISAIMPVIVLLVLSLPFTWWLNQFFKSIVPGFLITGILMAVLLPVLIIL